MKQTIQIARLFRGVHTGGNWTASDLKHHLSDIGWKEAIEKPGGLNSIAALVFHMNYYVRAMLQVLRGQPMQAHDKYSFDLPPITSQKEWEQLLLQMWTDAEAFASLVEALPEEKLWEVFVNEKYGNYYRNLHGVIEHIHYHLGQIVVIKKILRAQTAA